MERVLTVIRDKKDQPVDKDLYESLIIEQEVHEEDAEWHPDDRSYKFVSRKIRLLIYQYTDITIHKTLAEARDGCGLDAYILIEKLLDPQSDDMALTLQQNVMSVCKVVCKSVKDELAAVKEVQARIREMERRSGPTETVLREHPNKKIAHEAQLVVYAGMVFTS